MKRAQNQTDLATLKSIGQFFRLSLYPFTEDPVRPDLVGQYDRQEDQGNKGHNLERIRRGGGIVDRQAVRRIRARNHHPGKHDLEAGNQRQGQMHPHRRESPAIPFLSDEISGQ